MNYQFDHDWKHERERLAALEWSLDGYSISVLTAAGVAPGWRCLEIGAGAGSMAKWLAQRVGAEGRVVATDIDIGLLSDLSQPNVQVLRMDITVDAIPGQFDLVHARKVLEHLPEPARLIERMAGALRPGGWLVIEDADLTSIKHVSASDPELFGRGYHAFIEQMRAHGYHPELGLDLGDLLRAAGLRGVQVRGWSSEWTGAAPNPSIFLRTFQRIRERVIAEERLSPREADAFLELLQQPSFRAITATHFAAWGQSAN